MSPLLVAIGDGIPTTNLGARSATLCWSYDQSIVVRPRRSDDVYWGSNCWSGRSAGEYVWRSDRVVPHRRTSIVAKGPRCGHQTDPRKTAVHTARARSVGIVVRTRLARIVASPSVCDMLGGAWVRIVIVRDKPRRNCVWRNEQQQREEDVQCRNGLPCYMGGAWVHTCLVRLSSAVERFLWVVRRVSLTGIKALAATCSSCFALTSYFNLVHSCDGTCRIGPAL